MMTAAMKTASAGASGLLLILLALLVLAAYIGVAMLIARLARRKGRSFGAWFAIAFFISPILAAIVIATIAPVDPAGGPGHRPCPRCAEPVRTQANTCRFCGLDLAGEARTPLGSSGTAVRACRPCIGHLEPADHSWLASGPFRPQPSRRAHCDRTATVGLPFRALWVAGVGAADVPRRARAR